LLNEQNHDFAERFNDSKWVDKWLFSGDFYTFEVAKHLHAGKKVF